MDLFCKTTGGARLFSKARNQASNGKAERIHRTVFNMARLMIFACNMPSYFCEDAVEYVPYILSRGSTSANEKRASPYEVLTKVAPDFLDIVMSGRRATYDGTRARTL